ncbi:MAG TPA: thioredoxin domain-containing protein [Conexibacter sp.]|nr:thioredoxin domain-containing protein [Conexibacter sp.]
MADSTDTRKERRATARAERDRAAEAAQARRRQRLWILGGVVALAVVVVAVIAFAAIGGGDDKPAVKKGEIIPGQIETNARFAGIPQRGITVGNPNAPITLVEFADLQCPFCRDYSTNVMPTIVDRYVRNGKVKMEFRNVSFIGNDSLRGAQMAAAAGLQNKLWEYIDLFYLNQEAENSGYVSDEFLTRIGRAVRGLDVQRAMADRALPSVQRGLTEAQTEWTVAGFTGTPAFLLGETGGRMEAMLGQQVAPTVDNVSQAIEARLTAAR